MSNRKPSIYTTPDDKIKLYRLPPLPETRRRQDGMSIGKCLFLVVALCGIAAVALLAVTTHNRAVDSELERIERTGR